MLRHGQILNQRADNVNERGVRARGNESTMKFDRSGDSRWKEIEKSGARCGKATRQSLTKVDKRVAAAIASHA